jgi:hypothetical protein
MVQNLHSDIDTLLLNLDSGFGIAELVDKAEAVPAPMSCTLCKQNEPTPLRELTTAEVAREAAATCAAASRFSMAADDAKKLAERARNEMIKQREDAAKAAAYVSHHIECTT